MSDPKYLPAEDDVNGWLVKVAEESAELIQAATKAQRFGLRGCNPETKETNIMALTREYNDLISSWTMLCLAIHGGDFGHG